MSFESNGLQPVSDLPIPTDGSAVGTCGHEPPRFGCESCIAAAQPVGPFFGLSWDELDDLIEHFTAECVLDLGWPTRLQPLVADFLRRRLR